MPAKYEIDFAEFDIRAFRQKPHSYLLDLAKKVIDRDGLNAHISVRDIYDRFTRAGSITDGQADYLATLVKYESEEYKKYHEDMISWYNSRPDIQEMYQFAMKQEYVSVISPVTNRYCSKGVPEWNPSWEISPASPIMFWRAMSSWNVKKFRAVNADTMFEEGDLVELRKPFIGDWRYDALYDGKDTPPPTSIRLGTVMEMTDNVHQHSRAGKGSRLINVLFVGKAEVVGVPERVIKLHERKRRKKA